MVAPPREYPQQPYPPYAQYPQYYTPPPKKIDGKTIIIIVVIVVAVIVIVATIIAAYLITLPTLQKTVKPKPIVAFRVTVKADGDLKLTIEGEMLAWENMQLVIRNDTVGRKVDLSGSVLKSATGNVTTDNSGRIDAYFDEGDAITIKKGFVWTGDTLEIYYAGDRLYAHEI